jgi:thymidylate synthase
MGGKHIRYLIEELREHPNSRQLYLPVWWPNDETRRGKRRVPCSLGYQFMNRQGVLHITYMMRSCDFVTHYANDVALAVMLQAYVAKMSKNKVGTFNHFVGSLHAYRKDLDGVF